MLWQCILRTLVVQFCRLMLYCSRHRFFVLSITEFYNVESESILFSLTAKLQRWQWKHCSWTSSKVTGLSCREVGSLCSRFQTLPPPTHTHPHTQPPTHAYTAMWLLTMNRYDGVVCSCGVNRSKITCQLVLIGALIMTRRYCVWRSSWLHAHAYTCTRVHAHTRTYTISIVCCCCCW